jgi:serine O-acetyltransferase
MHSRLRSGFIKNTVSRSVQRFSTCSFKDYIYFERYLKGFCQKNQMTIDYTKLQQNEQLIVPAVWDILQKEAENVINKEPLMRPLVEDLICRHSRFKDALIYRLSSKLGGQLLSSHQWSQIFEEAYNIGAIDAIDADYKLENAACLDLVAIKDRDPACDTLLTAFLYFKGYKALQNYRVSHILWEANRKELALLLQSRTSEVFAVDIHPGAKIGRGLMIDHATGLVVGETAVIGEHCSFLHGVTLGGTGKESGNRHPKLGDNISIGCNASIIGNIRIGNNVRVGSNSVVLKPVPDNCTAVGMPARILFPKEAVVADIVIPVNALDSEKKVGTEASRPSVLLASPVDHSSDFRSHELVDLVVPVPVAYKHAPCPSSMMVVAMPLVLLFSVFSASFVNV